MDSSHDGSASGNSVSNTSRPETSTSSNEKEDNAAAVLAQREHRHVVRSKALVFVVLLLAAALVGFFTYWFLSESEKAAFESQVRPIATSMLSCSLDSIGLVELTRLMHLAVVP